MGQEDVRLHPGVPGGCVGATTPRWAAEPQQGEAPARVASFPGRDNQMYIFKHASAASPHSSDFSRLGGEKKKKIDKGFQKNTSSAEMSHRAAAASRCPWGPRVAFRVGDLGWDCPSRPPEALPWVLWDAARGADGGSPPSSCPARGLAASCPAGSEPLAVCL